MKPRSSSANADVVDDPCWGDPEHCSLEYLLTLLDRNKTILYESSDYIVMHKPADLRMDGEYPATVHKLITYWYPPPTLQGRDNLLNHIATLHRHSETPDKESQVRPCHQLDYATSGVLLMARTTEAATHASICFERRRVEKTYVAVLHGRVRPDPNWPVLPLDRVTAVLERQEDQYKRLQHKKRTPAKANTFDGYQPPNAFHQIFQGRYARTVAKSGKRKRERLSDDQWREVDRAIGLEAEDCARMSQMKWKQVREEPPLRDAMTRAAGVYNRILKEIMDTERAREGGGSTTTNNNSDLLQELPYLFRVQGEDPNVFYIYLAMAQVENEFAMRIPNHIQHALSLGLSTGDPAHLNFKVALTQCTILTPHHTEATLNEQPVTKVHLKPRTGRRHQLRVHTAFLGHAIVGDQTYRAMVTGGDDEDGKTANLTPRMCLHAYELGFPLLRPGSGKEGGGDGGGDNGNMLLATAPDPFPISKDGKLTVTSL